VLRGFEVFLREWEPHLRAALPRALASRFDETRRLHLVRRDLDALDELRLQGDALRISARLPLPDVPAAFGSWYVLAGSALGGQVIARQVGASLGLTPDSGAAYFHGWGADTARRWRDFLALLAHGVPDSEAARAAASQSARITFELLTDTFQQTLNEPVIT
jgi:heme oxygenase